MNKENCFNPLLLCGHLKMLPASSQKCTCLKKKKNHPYLFERGREREWEGERNKQTLLADFHSKVYSPNAQNIRDQSRGQSQNYSHLRTWAIIAASQDVQQAGVRSQSWESTPGTSTCTYTQYAHARTLIPVSLNHCPKCLPTQCFLLKNELSLQQCYNQTSFLHN